MYHVLAFVCLLPHYDLINRIYFKKAWFISSSTCFESTHHSEVVCFLLLQVHGHSMSTCPTFSYADWSVGSSGNSLIMTFSRKKSSCYLKFSPIDYLCLDYLFHWVWQNGSEMILSGQGTGVGASDYVPFLGLVRFSSIGCVTIL